MGKRRRAKHGARAKRPMAGKDKDKGWGDSESWSIKYLTAFVKERKKVMDGDKMAEEEQQRIAMLVGTRAEKLKIRPAKAGALAALLCEDIAAARVKLMQDLIENPGILKAARMVMEGKGLEDYEDEEEAEDLEEACGAGDTQADA